MSNNSFFSKSEKGIPLLLQYLKRTFQFGVILLFLWLFYFFYHPYVLFFGRVIENPFYEFLVILPFWLYLVACFIIIAFIAFIGFVFLSAFFSYRNTSLEKKRDRYKKIFISEVTKHLFQGEDYNTGHSEDVREKLGPYIKTNLQTEVYFQVITGIQEIIAIDLSKKFVQLNAVMKVNKRLVRFLYSNRFDRRILALKVISYLRVSDFNSTIREYASSANFALRTEALAALIRLSEFDHLSYLLSTKNNLSLLEINVIVNAVIRNFKMDIDYTTLLTPDNPRIAIIGVEIARNRHRTDLLPRIESLRNHSYSLLKKQAWKTVIELKGEKAIMPLVIREFSEQNQKTQIAILKAMQSCTEEAFFDFLEKLAIEYPIPVKLLAMKILFNNSYERLSPFMRKSDVETHKAFLETIDLNIY